MNKYKLTNETIEVNGVTLYRIVALKSFSDVKIGQLGGYVQSLDNLAQTGNCWIYDDVKVYGNARVYGDARVFSNVVVSGNAMIAGNAIISGNARVYDDTKIYGNVVVFGYARVWGNAWVYGDARVYGGAEIYGNARVFGDTKVYGNAVVYGYAEVYGNAGVFSNTKVCGNARVYGDARVRGNAVVSGDAIIKCNTDYLTFFSGEYDCTATRSNMRITIRCKNKTIDQWLEVNKMQFTNELNTYKSYETLRSFVLFCKQRFKDLNNA